MATSEDFRHLRKFIRIVEAIQRECEPDVPMSYVRVLAEIMLAHLEGGDSRTRLCQTDIMGRIAVEQSSLSRAVAAITDRRDAIRRDAYELADWSVDVEDRRRRNIKLNDRGIRLLVELLTIVEGGPQR